MVTPTGGMRWTPYEEAVRVLSGPPLEPWNRDEPEEILAPSGAREP
ncbi:hypothetical protein [Jiangella mangrovi]|uniref:Uncharacterized protein n=1 Tax=Jiangella mangrovi TaxID=1524084 RepID=A0A7W9LPK4_9ACTN|nr:hypothetical protein [Jiangella mangrovi]MBB5791485.1 hypothetical protein [Jiangella mangrovi]